MELTGRDPDVSSTGDILRKKLRPRASVQGVSVTWWGAQADRLLRALFKTSFNVDVALSEVGGGPMAVAGALEEMAPVTLPFLLGLPDGRRGLFTMDGALIDALIELQMLGKVMSMPRLDRPITAIDAGLSEVFVRAVLEAFKAGPSGLSGLTTLGPQQDHAALRLALGEGRVDVLRAKIDLGPGIKTGFCSIWVPAEVARPVSVAPKPASGAMKAVLDQCKIDLSAQMHGVKVSALDLARLSVGSTVPLPMSALSEVELRDCTDAPFAQARLGRLHGARALRITQMKSGHVGAGHDAPQSASQIAFEAADMAAGDAGAAASAGEAAKGSAPATGDALAPKEEDAPQVAARLETSIPKAG